MNGDAIYHRYVAALAEQQETSPVVRLALRLAIDETTTTSEPTNSTHPPYIECARQFDLLRNFLELQYPRILTEHPDVAAATLSLIETLQIRVNTRDEQLLHLHQQLDDARNGLEKAKAQLADCKASHAELLIERQELQERYDAAQATLNEFFESPLPGGAKISVGANHTVETIVEAIPSLAPGVSATNGNNNHIDNPFTTDAPAATDAPAWPSPKNLSKEARSWWEQLGGKKTKWRYAPKPIQREIARHILTLGPKIGEMTMIEFNGKKPDWMPSPSSIAKTLGISWIELNKGLPGSAWPEQSEPKEGPFTDNPELNGIAQDVITNRTSFGRLNILIRLRLIRHILDKTEGRTELEYNRTRPNWMPTSRVAIAMTRMNWHQIANSN